MIFDAFGRLALGQVEQNFASDTTFLRGVSAVGSIGAIRPTVSPLEMMGVGSTASAGVVSDNVLVTLHGVSASSHAGTILTPDNDVVSGVSGTGSAGTISTALQVPTVNGVQGTGSAGIVVGKSSTVIVPAAPTAIGTAGLMYSFNVAKNILGVSAVGHAGLITTKASGGGGGKKPKTGLEPVAKRSPAPPIPVKLPTYVLPNFKPKAPTPLPPAARTPFERSPGIAPLDLMGMRQQIQSAQDEADIKAVLAFLDDLD